MEYLQGGDLMGLLMKHDTFTEAATRLYMAETAMAIAHVHTIGYIHRDLKPDNILIDWFGNVKLTDLGLCTRIDKDPMLNVFDVNKHGMEIEEPGMGAKEAKTPEGASSAIQGKGIWAKGNTPPPPHASRPSLGVFHCWHSRLYCSGSITSKRFNFSSSIYIYISFNQYLQIL